MMRQLGSIGTLPSRWAQCQQVLAGTSPEMASSEAKDRSPGLLQVPQRLVFQHLHQPVPYGTTPARAPGWGRGDVGAPAGPAGTALTLSEGRLQWCQEAGNERVVKCA